MRSGGLGDRGLRVQVFGIGANGVLVIFSNASGQHVACSCMVALSGLKPWLSILHWLLLSRMTTLLLLLSSDSIHRYPFLKSGLHLYPGGRSKGGGQLSCCLVSIVAS